MNIQDAIPRHPTPSRATDLNYNGTAILNMFKHDIRRFVVNWNPPIRPPVINEPINAVTLSANDEIIDNDERKDYIKDSAPT